MTFYFIQHVNISIIFWKLLSEQNLMKWENIETLRDSIRNQKVYTSSIQNRINSIFSVMSNIFHAITAENFWHMKKQKDIKLPQFYWGWVFLGLLKYGGGKKAPFPKISYTYPTTTKLGTIIPYLKKIKKNYKFYDTLLEFFWHLFTAYQQLLLYQ